MDVDVVIPIHNGEAYINRALDSILKQTWAPINVIVVDDGSEDSSASIVRTYQTAHTNIRLLQTKHVGLSAARNLGIAAASSTYVALLDCDDYWGPRKLEHQIKYLVEHPDCSVVFSNCFIDNEIKKTIYEAVSNKETEFTYENIFLQKYRVIGSASSACIKLEILKKVGMFSENISYGEDYDLWVRLGALTRFHEVKHRDVFITIRTGSMQTIKQAGIASFRNSTMYFEVWTKNKIDFKCYLNEFKKLIWPDIYRALKRRPTDLLDFFDEIQKRYPIPYSLIFSSSYLKFNFVVFNLFQGACSRVTRFLRIDLSKS